MNEILLRPIRSTFRDQILYYFHFYITEFAGLIALLDIIGL